MTRDEILTHLLRWSEIVAEVSAVDDALEELTGRAPEGRLTTAMWSVIGAYGQTLETLLIGNAESGWLEWFLWENDMGNRGHVASVGPKSEDRPIDSLEAFADLLMDCRP